MSVREILRQIDHRPWPVPRQPFVMHMSWHDLLFAHWPVDADILRPLIPPSLELDLFDGQAYLGVVPFRMTNVRPRGVPPFPPLTSFLELNVRTYVSAQGKPGVWFFSLDAANRLAVRGARRFFHLPYFDARMSLSSHADRYEYKSCRTHRGATPADFAGTYGPAGAVRLSKPGSLEHWLTERYCLYAADGKERLWRGDIHHVPWPLQPAWLDLELNTMLAGLGLTLTGAPSSLLFAQKIDVVGWWLQRVVAK